MENDDGKPDGQTEDRGASHVRAVSDDGETRTLAPKHLADLESSGLTAQTIEWSQVRSEGKSSAIADVLGWSWRNGGGLVFPFIDYDSRKVVLARVKPDRPRHRQKRGKRKPVKYEQPPNTSAHPYIGPHTIREQRFDGAAQVVWGEGEKKTLLLDQLGHAAIGLTGCHNFNDAEALKNGDGLQWSKALAKYAQRFVKGKRHLLCPDSDVFTNDNVMLANRRLAGLLLEGGAMSVHMVAIPGGDDGIGIDDYFVSHGTDKTRALFAAAVPVAPGEDISPIAPKDPLVKLSSLSWLRPAKLDADLRLPPRFEVRRDRSLWVEPSDARPDGEYKEIMRSVMLPVRLLDELDGDEQRIEVTYYARGRWHRDAIDRKAVRDARRALAELPPGVTVDSNNAAHVVLWIGEYMRHNELRMRAFRFVSACGWQDTEDERCFLLDVPITAGTSSTLVADDAGERSEIIKALKPRGKFDAHASALRAAFAEDTVAAIAILGALAAPLLEPLGAPNFAINFHGDSSRGKSSMLKIASSVYGNPRSEQWVGSWNATGTAMELRAATLSHLPLCFDEVGAGDLKSIDRWIYMLINGSGKSRGDRTLRVRKTFSWRTVVLSTGEHELVDEQANTGAQVRVLQFRVRGFGDLDAAGVDALRDACERNFGHVGRRWIESLVAIEDWSKYVELFEESKRQFRSKESGALMQRQSVYYALLAVTEHLASSALGVGELGGKTVRGLFADTSRRREVQGAAERAREVVSEWIASEPLTFPALEINSGGALVAKTVASVKRINGVRYRGFVCFLPSELRARLQAHGISHSEATSAWNDAGELDTDPGRKTKRMRWDGKRVNVFAVACGAVGLDDAAGTQASLSGDFGD